MSDPWTGIECDWHQQPDSAALKNAMALVAACRSAGFPPSEATTGYWPTVRLLWDCGKVEVEVFGDRFELYVLHGAPSDGPFHVEDHEAPGSMVELTEKIRAARSTRHD